MSANLSDRPAVRCPLHTAVLTRIASAYLLPDLAASAALCEQQRSYLDWPQPSTEQVQAASAKLALLSSPGG